MITAHRPRGGRRAGRTMLRSAIFAHPAVAEGLTFLLVGPPTS
jgi:hypothetical protein